MARILSLYIQYLISIRMIVIILASLLGVLLGTGTTPTEQQMLGQWGYVDNSYVFMENSGETPAKQDVDIQLKAMGATKSNLVLSFSEGHKGNLRLGDNSMDFDWELNSSTKAFKAMIGPFSIKGHIVKKGDRLVLVYSRSNLFLIMRYLCSAEGKKHMAPLGKLLDSCKGLTLAMEFTKN